MTVIWCVIPAAEKNWFGRIRNALGDQKILPMTMNVSLKINMLLGIETCEDFIEFIGLSIWVI